MGDLATNDLKQLDRLLLDNYRFMYNVVQPLITQRTNNARIAMFKRPLTHEEMMWFCKYFGLSNIVGAKLIVALAKCLKLANKSTNDGIYYHTIELPKKLDLFESISFLDSVLTVENMPFDLYKSADLLRDSLADGCKFRINPLLASENYYARKLHYALVQFEVAVVEFFVDNYDSSK